MPKIPFPSEQLWSGDSFPLTGGMNSCGIKRPDFRLCCKCSEASRIKMLFPPTALCPTLRFLVSTSYQKEQKWTWPHACLLPSRILFLLGDPPALPVSETVILQTEVQALFVFCTHYRNSNFHLNMEEGLLALVLQKYLYRSLSFLVLLACLATNKLIVFEQASLKWDWRHKKGHYGTKMTISIYPDESP